MLSLDILLFYLPIEFFFGGGGAGGGGGERLLRRKHSMAARAVLITLVLYWAKLCKNSDVNKTVTTLQQLEIILPVCCH